MNLRVLFRPIFRPTLPLFLAITIPTSVLASENTNGPASAAGPTRAYDVALEPMRLHTKETQLLNARGEPVNLRGVNIASLEWTTEGDHMKESFDHAIRDWKVNFIRLPLAQDRWFGKMTNQMDGGEAYRKLVDSLVDTCVAARVYIDLDLHWSDCGQWVNEGGKLGQHLLGDRHSIEFWQALAVRYRNHPLVIFGLYNEPHDVTFAVWRDGGTVTDKPARWNPDQSVTTYEGAGMQQLYEAVRAAGAENLVTVSGNDWGYDLSGVLQGYGIRGTNFVYETHPYPFKKQWDACFGEVSAKYPVFVGEWGVGRTTNALQYCREITEYMDRHRIQCWTAWDFHTSAGPTLIRNWSYEPTTFGQFVKDVLSRSPGNR